MEENPLVLQRLEMSMHVMSRTLPFAGEEWERRSIYKLPTFVTSLKRRAFNPQIVSIGPYHHGELNLYAMEEHKHRSLFYFLKRSKEPLQSYVNALIPVVQELKDAYDHLDPKWQLETEAFLELMILDGCFILEILSATASTDYGTLNEDYDANDPIVSSHGKFYLVPLIMRDMLMLENQLPLLVLAKLVNVKMGSSNEESMELLTALIVDCFYGQSFLNTRRKFLTNSSILHILDIYRKMLVLDHPPIYRRHARENLNNGYEVILSATELYESGIKFRKSKSRSLKDISFRDGLLYLPVIVLDDTIESLYENMIAFERFHVGAGSEVSSYIFFMSSVIKSPADVTLLQSHGIVQNVLGSNKAVVNLLNSLSMDVTLDPDNSLFEVQKEVQAYCMKPWNKSRANLMHDYFNNPKDSLNIQMGLFLFIFTIIQTIFTVLSYTSSTPRSTH